MDAEISIIYLSPVVHNNNHGVEVSVRLVLERADWSDGWSIVSCV